MYSILLIYDIYLVKASSVKVFSWRSSSQLVLERLKKRLCAADLQQLRLYCTEIGTIPALTRIPDSS